MRRHGPIRKEGERMKTEAISLPDVRKKQQEIVLSKVLENISMKNTGQLILEFKDEQESLNN